MKTINSVPAMLTAIEAMLNDAPRRRSRTHAGSEYRIKSPCVENATGGPHSGQRPSAGKPRRLYWHLRHGRSIMAASASGTIDGMESHAVIRGSLSFVGVNDRGSYATEPVSQPTRRVRRYSDEPD